MAISEGYSLVLNLPFSPFDAYFYMPNPLVAFLATLTLLHHSPLHLNKVRLIQHPLEASLFSDMSIASALNHRHRTMVGSCSAWHPRSLKQPCTQIGTVMNRDYATVALCHDSDHNCHSLILDLVIYIVTVNGTFAARNRFDLPSLPA